MSKVSLELTYSIEEGSKNASIYLWAIKYLPGLKFLGPVERTIIYSKVVPLADLDKEKSSIAFIAEEHYKNYMARKGRPFFIKDVKEIK